MLGGEFQRPLDCLPEIVAIQRKAVIDEAKRWLGTPFHHNAQILGAGIDCGRFLTATYSAVGLNVPKNLEHWPADWSHHAAAKSEPYLRVILEFAHEVPSPLPGDFALFKVGRAFGHSGIVIDWPMMIHAIPSAGVEYCDASQPPFARRPVKFFSFW